MLATFDGGLGEELLRLLALQPEGVKGGPAEVAGDPAGQLTALIAAELGIGDTKVIVEDRTPPATNPKVELADQAAEPGQEPWSEAVAEASGTQVGQVLEAVTDG
jgi:hypothetical protein